MVYQDLSKNDEISHVGCYFTDIYNYKGLVLGQETSYEELSSLWEVSKSKGFIDSNLDIANPQGIVDIMGYNLKYVDSHFDAATLIPDNTYCIGAYQWHIIHFIVLRQDKSIWMDPISVGSQTAKNGQLISMRFYSIL